MARKLRVQYPDAVYHVMNRGDRREPIYNDDQDRSRFLETLGEACGKTGWQVTWKWIAIRLEIGIWTHVANRIYHQK